MFKEILKITPKIEGKDMSSMERLLNTRFGNVAKKFGSGLKSALKFGAISSMGMMIIDKILNPLKETQDALDRILTQSDDLVTYSKEFGTTAGKLFKLQQLALSTGLDEGSLYFLMMKFQSALAEAESDKNKPSSVREFVGRTDKADAFFDFIQALQKMDKTDQIMIQQEVFGERQMLKLSEFLGTDFASKIKEIGAKSSEHYDAPALELARLKDLSDALTSRRNLSDMAIKGRTINEKMIYENHEAEKEKLRRENSRLTSYEDIKKIQAASDLVLEAIEKLLFTIVNLSKQVVDISEGFKEIRKSRWLRGLFGG